ncbi:START domain-containing protein [Acinetobacter sp. YH12239]|uniref:START domain-containing protein n=1 Tax=Acinetobacter sp. YH12239 TaxID=2601166 RepID=UPI0015D30E1E|nr:START domain-containing protein [Acinetobacter sp. YH12239]
MKKISMICLLVSAIGLTSQVQANEASRLTINKNNIKVWTIQNPDHPVLSYRAETVVDASLERAVAIVLDVENAKSWVPNVGSAQVISQDLKQGEFKLYMVLDFPFPLKDRDLIVQGKMYKDSKGIIHIKNKASQTGKSKNPQYIRLQHYVGDWSFEQIGPNKVKVSTSGYADPEGAIPQSVTNMFVQQQPYQMLQKMKTELAKSQSAQIPLPDILK